MSPSHRPYEQPCQSGKRLLLQFYTEKEEFRTQVWSSTWQERGSPNECDILTANTPQSTGYADLAYLDQDTTDAQGWCDDSSN